MYFGSGIHKTVAFNNLEFYKNKRFVYLNYYDVGAKPQFSTLKNLYIL